MPIELLLVRHGKAEDRTAEKDDTKRQLTKKGIEEFTAFISSIKEEVQTVTDVLVWTSPLKRAKQTASILTDQWELEKAEKKDFLASGDFDAFMAGLSEVDADTRVICVGHEPILGDWLEELTGTEYSFKKGGVALVRLDEDTLKKGTLLWDSDPKSKKKDIKKTTP